MSTLIHPFVAEQNEIVVDEKTKKPTAICFICRKAFGDENSIYRHMKIHDETSRHQCPLCPGIHVQRYNLRIHMETHIGMDVSQEIMDTLPSDFRGVLEGDPDIIAPVKYRKKLIRAVRKRIKTANCHEVVQNLQTKLLSLEHGIA
ncbi:putative transcription factor Ovo-like 1 [Tigriopus californicus]|uniref:putative transcription factor Ovo-like 1 n=1 Tax=Tigriopus californicus TaxID=6832 RepID=UPI0027D9F282|nr:putative transcription factor Ovo-like 1 [Tigriopus californicus]